MNFSTHMATIPRITNSQPLPHLACLIITPTPFNQLALLIVDNTASFIWFIALVEFSCPRSWACFVVLPTLNYSFEVLSRNIELIWIKASTIHFLVTIINLAHRINNKLIWRWCFWYKHCRIKGSSEADAPLDTIEMKHAGGFARREIITITFLRDWTTRPKRKLPFRGQCRLKWWITINASLGIKFSFNRRWIVIDILTLR